MCPVSPRSGALFRACAVAALALVAAAPAGAVDPMGSVHGFVTFDLAGARLADLGPVVVYLEPSDGSAVAMEAAEPFLVHQKNARFAPEFVAVAKGQTLSMQNDDAIYHNVFSYSRDNKFDLGTYPAGDARSVTMRSKGAVRIYCSIHENMNGTIFVAPTPWFDRASVRGGFEINNVPPGVYKLTVWCEKLPDVATEVVVVRGEISRVDVSLGAALTSAR